MCIDGIREIDLNWKTEEETNIENLKNWVKFYMGRVDTEMEELKDIVGLVTGNVTSKTYRGKLKLHLDLMKKFGDVTYALGDLNSRVQKLQTKFTELGKSSYIFYPKVETWSEKSIFI